MPTVPIGRKQISYWIGGRGFVEGREAVLFIHGAGGGKFTWSFQKGTFEKQFNPIILDLPGHGESGGEGEQEIGKYAEQVYAFLKALDLPKAFLVGHSMGGAIVQTLALAHPEVIRGIVLVGTGARLKVFPMILEGIMKSFEETVRKMVPFTLSPKSPPELMERGINEMMRCKPGILYGDFLACDRFDMMNEVQRINLPTLVLCGNDDMMTPVKYSQFLHERIKGSKLEVLANAGHLVMMESPDAFNEKVSGFIKELVKD